MRQSSSDDDEFCGMITTQIGRTGCDVNTNGDRQKFACCIANGEMCDDGCTGTLPSTGKPKANWIIYSTGTCSKLCGGGTKQLQYRCKGRFHKVSFGLIGCVLRGATGPISVGMISMPGPSGISQCLVPGVPGVPSVIGVLGPKLHLLTMYVTRPLPSFTPPPHSFVGLRVRPPQSLRSQWSNKEETCEFAPCTLQAWALLYTSSRAHSVRLYLTRLLAWLPFSYSL